MALVAMSTATTVPFVSKRDPDYKVVKVPVDPDDPTKGEKDEVQIGADACTFNLRPLDVFLMGHIFDNASSMTGKSGSDEVGIKTRINQTNIDAVRFSVIAPFPSNFKDANGVPVKAKVEKVVVNHREYQALDEYSLNTLGLALIAEIADKVREISGVGAAEEKK